MSKVPRIRGTKAVGAFEKAGFKIARQSSSHVILKKGAVRLNIPVHAGKDVGIGLLAAQIKLAGLTVDEFKDLL